MVTPDGYPNYPLAVIGPLAQKYLTLDRYFCSFAGETYPNRFYQHAAQTDRDHNSEAPSTLPTIWDQLSPIANTAGVPTGGYYYRDIPFLALWADPAIEPGATFKYQAFFHPFANGDPAALSSGTSFVPAAGPPGHGRVRPGGDVRGRQRARPCPRRPSTSRPTPPGPAPSRA